MNEALYDLNMGIETYTVIGLVILAWLILATVTLYYAAWYKKNCIRPDSSAAFLGEGSEQLTQTTINKKTLLVK